MTEPSGPLNGQGRVVEGLVKADGTAGLKLGGTSSAVAGSAYVGLATVVEGIAGGTPVPISGTVATGGATEAEIGIVTETAPGTDTASSGLNGRLQRIAQRLTSLIALLPTALGAGGGLMTEGNVAHDAVDSGNPVKIGGKASTTTPTAVAAGDRVDAWYTTTGARMVATDNGAGDGPTLRNVAGSGGLIATLADLTGAITPSTGGTLPTAALGYAYDGTGWSMARGNIEATLLASAARTATASSADQTNYNGRGALIVIDVTSITATPSLVVTVEAKDALSGKYVTLLTSAAITTVSTVQLAVYPGVTAAANLAVSMILPRTWRVTVTAADADSATYSVGASNIL